MGSSVLLFLTVASAWAGPNQPALTRIDVYSPEPDLTLEEWDGLELLLGAAVTPPAGQSKDGWTCTWRVDQEVIHDGPLDAAGNCTTWADLTGLSLGRHRVEVAAYPPPPPGGGTRPEFPVATRVQFLRLVDGLPASLSGGLGLSYDDPTSPYTVDYDFLVQDGYLQVGPPPTLDGGEEAGDDVTLELTAMPISAHAESVSLGTATGVIGEDGTLHLTGSFPLGVITDTYGDQVCGITVLAEVSVGAVSDGAEETDSFTSSPLSMRVTVEAGATDVSNGGGAGLRWSAGDEAPNDVYLFDLGLKDDRYALPEHLDLHDTPTGTGAVLGTCVVDGTLPWIYHCELDTGSMSPDMSVPFYVYERGTCVQLLAPDADGDGALDEFTIDLYEPAEFDNDGDGATEAGVDRFGGAAPVDCDDTDDTRYVGATETCLLGDEDCDGVVNDGLSVTEDEASPNDELEEATLQQDSFGEEVYTIDDGVEDFAYTDNLYHDADADWYRVRLQEWSDKGRFQSEYEVELDLPCEGGSPMEGWVLQEYRTEYNYETMSEGEPRFHATHDGSDSDSVPDCSTGVATLRWTLGAEYEYVDGEEIWWLAVEPVSDNWTEGMCGDPASLAPELTYTLRIAD